jgi:hypothetical protein
MYRLGDIRQRDGAIRWSLWNDLAEAGRYSETFIFESWAEHKRQHERVTVTDLEIEQRAIVILSCTPVPISLFPFPILKFTSLSITSCNIIYLIW